MEENRPCGSSSVTKMEFGSFLLTGNSQQKRFFMLSQLKGMAFMLVVSFIKLSLLVIRGFGTDIVDLNSTNMNLNSFSRFG